jgi:hypothetical protein
VGQSRASHSRFRADFSGLERTRIGTLREAGIPLCMRDS